MRRNYCCHQWMCLAGCQGVHWLLGRCQRLWKTSILSNHKIVFDWGWIMNSRCVCHGQISLLGNRCSGLWWANGSTAIEVLGPNFLVCRELPVGTGLAQRESGPQTPLLVTDCSSLDCLMALPQLAPAAHEKVGKNLWYGGCLGIVCISFSWSCRLLCLPTCDPLGLAALLWSLQFGQARFALLWLTADILLRADPALPSGWTCPQAQPSCSKQLLDGAARCLGLAFNGKLKCLIIARVLNVSDWTSE